MSHPLPTAVGNTGEGPPLTLFHGASGSGLPEQGGLAENALNPVPMLPKETDPIREPWLACAHLCHSPPWPWALSGCSAKERVGRFLQVSGREQGRAEVVSAP